LTPIANADMMSDMKTFTVRELDREPSRVLDVCDHEGEVQIRRRDGRRYTIKPELAHAKTVNYREWFEECRRRTKKLFGKPMSRKQVEEFDRLIAGE